MAVCVRRWDHEVGVAAQHNEGRSRILARVERGEGRLRDGIGNAGQFANIAAAVFSSGQCLKVKKERQKPIVDVRELHTTGVGAVLRELHNQIRIEVNSTRSAGIFV